MDIVDRVYRDFGPMESINQTGRDTTVNGVVKGVVTLVNLVNEDHYDRPFCRIYSPTMC